MGITDPQGSPLSIDERDGEGQGMRLLYALMNVFANEKLGEHVFST
jgi:hypothetical protein